MVAELQEQLHDMEIELEDAQDHIDMHHEQMPYLHAEMDLDDDDDDDAEDEEPPEVQGNSGMDYEAAAPPQPQMGAHSPASSEASVNDLDDY